MRGKVCGELVAVLVLGACVMTLGAVQPVDAQEVPGQPSAERVGGDWLIYRLNAEPDTLNPITAVDLPESLINMHVYETLLTRNLGTLELEPQLCESYTISEDHLTYTFRLRQGVQWHDGHPFTAADVEFSYNTIKNPKVDAPHLRNYFRDVERMEVLDPYTVRFTCRQPYFMALEVLGGLPILPKHIFERGDFNTHPNGRHSIGTGPYVFDSWETGKQVVLVRNKSYWNRDKRPHLDRIVFKIITDDVVALDVLKKGQLDMMGLTPIQWVRQTQTERFRKGFEKYDYYLPNYNYIGWNMRRTYFEDKRVRQALTMMLDREKILRTLRFGLGKLVTNNFYVNGPYYDHTMEPWPYDPERAEALLAEAGWVDHDGDGVRDKDGVPFAFEFLIPAGGVFQEQLATILKEELEQEGIRMTIRKLEWAVFTEQLKDRAFDATSLGWSLGVEADPYQVWHSSQAERGSNFVGFINEEADRLIEEARREFDKGRRTELYKRFQQILHEEQPYTFLYCNPALVAISRRFENVRVYPLGVNVHEWFVPLDKQKYRD